MVDTADKVAGKATDDIGPVFAAPASPPTVGVDSHARPSNLSNRQISGVKAGSKGHGTGLEGLSVALSPCAPSSFSHTISPGWIT
jgi:hypothetical protein